MRTKNQIALTRKTLHVIILITIFFSAFGAQPALAEAANTLPTCISHQGFATNGRALVLLQGIGTHAGSYADQAAVWSYLTSDGTVSDLYHLYNYFIYFSYNENNPDSYSESDTYKSLWSHHRPLLHDLLESCHQRGIQSFDIIGHSLGGVIASEYIKLYGLNSSQAGWVKHVITLDSPVNGAIRFGFSLLPFLPALHLSNPVSQLVISHFDAIRTSIAGQEMAGMYSDRGIFQPQNVLFAKRLHEKGTEFWTLTNNDDIIVPTDDAVILGSGRYYYLGRNLNMNNLGDPSAPVGHNQIFSDSSVRNDINVILSQEPSGGALNPIPLPPTPSVNDLAAFIADITLPDGTVISPNQSLTKIWRVKNSGQSTWNGFKLKFISGERMGGPSEITIPTTAPGQTGDLSINLVAPSAPGQHSGSWQIVNQSGTWVQGGQVSISIKTAANAGSGQITMFDISPASPSSASTVHVVGRIKPSLDFRSMRFVLGNQVQEMTNFRHVGDQSEISFDWNTASLARGNYTIAFEVAKNGDPHWANPERQVKTYTLSGTPASNNHAPDRPALKSPYDWYLKDSAGASAAVELCVNPSSDPEGNPVQYWFEVKDQGGGVYANSGWNSSACWTHSYAPTTYAWRVKTGDGSAESDWSSDTWHFSVAGGGVYIGSDSLFNLNTDDTHLCVFITYDGIQGPDVHAWINEAADGSESGTWRLLDHYGPNTTPDCTQPNYHGFWIRSTRYETGNHALRISAVKPDSGNSATKTTSYNIAYIRPSTPDLIAPSTITNNGTWWNTRSIHFAWNPSLRADHYTLRVSANANPWADPSPLLNEVLGSGVTSYDHTFSQDYAQLYWSVQAGNSAGSTDSGSGTWFGIDLVAPGCQVPSLPSSIYSNVFQVNWNSTDNSAGIQSSAIQFMDSDRGAWEDWLAGVPADKTYDLFSGQPGHTYFFRCRATDNAGNTGNYPNAANTSIVIDPFSQPGTPWWDHAYGAKRNIVILNNMPGVPLPQGYPVHIHFDTSTVPTAAALYDASLAGTKCDDLRIVYNDAIELERIVDNCTSAAIDIWFRSQVSILGGTTDNTAHQLYFGNASAGAPPVDRNKVLYPALDSNSLSVFDMREGSGSILHDSVGGGDATIDSQSTWVATGKFGPAVLIPGDLVPEPRYGIYAGNKPQPSCSFTAETWLKRTPGHNYGGGFLISQENTNDTPSIWNFRIGGDNRLAFSIFNPIGWGSSASGNQQIDTPSFFNNWHHLAVTFDCSGEVKFYIDGLLDATRSVYSGIRQYSAPLRIGYASYNNQRVAGMISGAALSAGVRTDFSYGSFATITNEPSLATGSVIMPSDTLWWDHAYGERMNVVILNNMSDVPLPQGYPVHIHFDGSTMPTAAAIYDTSLSSPKCNDLRIIYNHATELDRSIQSCSNSSIDIWFRSHMSVAAGSTDYSSHQLYYGSASAGNPPSDPNQVWYPYREADTTNLYFFQEGGGGTTYDSSGNSRNCSLNSSVQWATSKFGNGLRFNRANGGDSRSLSCGSALASPSFTIEFWYKADADDGGRIAGELAGGGNGGGGNNWLVQNSEGHIALDVWEKGGVKSDFNLRDTQYMGKWNYIAVTFNGGDEVKFYINGYLNSTKYLSQGGVNTYSPPLEIGSSEGINQIKANLGALRISSSVKTSFPYGAFAAITNEPSLAAGNIAAPPVTGSPDLAVLSLVTYSNPDGGVLVEAVVQNQGNLSTQSGFYTDLYLDHIPTSAGDYTNSAQFWVNDPIGPGETVTLTTVITDLSSLGQLESQSFGTFTETSGTLYAQTDSAGLVTEPDDQNNIYSAGTDVCTASPDGFDSDGGPGSAFLISPGESQTHNFDAQGDEDWLKFNAQAGNAYRWKTSNSGVAADTTLSLYDNDGQTLLASNDDFDNSLASQLDWSAPQTGTYYVMVKNWNPNTGGCGTAYTVELSDISGLPTPTPTDTLTYTPTSAPTITQTPALTPTLTTTFTPTVTSTSSPTFTPTATPIPYNGTGVDGDLVVASGQTSYTDDIHSALSSAGGNTLTVISPAGFVAGQRILVIQMQGTGAGNYEFGQIESVSGSTLVLLQNLHNSYAVGSGSKAQVLRVPQYHNVTIQNGGIIRANSWDGNTGGIVAFLASGFVTVDGSISENGNAGATVQNATGGGATGGGFRGGNAIMSSNGNRSIPAFAGEGMNGPSVSTSSANGVNGGGAGHGSAGNPNNGMGGGSGGGGANGTSGTKSTSFSYGDGYNGDGGQSVGLPDLSVMFLGGGGGGGLTDNTGTVGGGGSGGGIIYIASDSITVSSTGSIAANGGKGGNGDYGQGGGGAGGSIFIKGSSVSLAVNKVTAIGGDKGDYSQNPSLGGGIGGNGRVRIEYGQSLSGSANPAADTYLDSALVPTAIPTVTWTPTETPTITSTFMPTNTPTANPTTSPFALLTCSTPENISNTPGYSWYPAIWVEPSGIVHAVWEEGPLSGDRVVLYARMTPDGIWSAVESVSILHGSGDPTIVVDPSGTAHVAWFAQVINAQIYYAFKPAGGTWSAASQVTSASGGASGPDLAVEPNGTLHLVYNEHPGGPNEIYHRAKAPGGAWSAPENVSNTAGDSQIASVAVDSSGNLQAIWLEGYPNGRTYEASKPIGGSWSSATPLSTASDSAWQNDLSVDSQGTFHAVWDQGSNTPYYASRPVGGIWSTPIQVSSVVGIRPMIAVDTQDIVHVAWGGLSHAWKPLGGIWSVQPQVAQPDWYGNIESQPVIGMDAQGNVHLVWNSNPSGNAETWHVDCIQTGLPTPTPTPTETLAPTPTVTHTATDTSTPTETYTPISTVTLTATITLTPTETLTLTPTVTYTATSAPTETATSTPIETPTVTRTLTPIPTFTETRTLTPTVTHTATVTSTETHTSTPTVTDTSIVTSTSTKTLTPTLIVTHTATSTPTSTHTSTATATVAPTIAQIGVNIAGTLVGNYSLPSQGSLRVNYTGLDSGPVRVASTNGVPIISAIRDAWAVNGVTTSFSQLMGLPLGQVSDRYVFPGYNNVTLNDQLRIGNVDTIPSTVTVTIGGVLRGTYLLQPDEALRVNYAGLDSGPVIVDGTDGVDIISAIREAWAVNGLTKSSVQLMGLPATQLSDKYVFPAYNNVTLNEQLRIGNVDTVPSTVTVKIGGLLQGTYILQPNEAVRVNYAGVDSGPVIVDGTDGVDIISAIREAWAVNGVTTSFSQLMGVPATQLSDKYVFPAYNNVTLNEQLRIGNVDTVPSTITVRVGGVLQGTYTLQANEAVRVNYAGVDSGPVIVDGTDGVHIISAIREAWAVNNVTQSFVQLMGLPFGQLSSTYLFPAYDNLTLNEQLRIAVP